MVLERKILKDLKSLEDVYSEISYLELYSTLKIIDYSREAYYNLLYDELEIVYNDQYKKSLLLIELAKQRRDREITKKSLNVDLSDLFKHNPKTYNSLKEQVFVASESTMSRVNQNITTIISDSYREGEGINTISHNIGNKFKQLKTYESRRIARTEVNSVQNLSSFNAYYDDEDVQYIQWWTGEDNRVRDTHKALHGHIVRLGDRFSNGLKYPGDSDGPIKEWINCRCTTVPYLIPLGMMAPSMTEFTEDDLVPIPGWEDLRLEDALSGVNKPKSTLYYEGFTEEGGEFIDKFRTKRVKAKREYAYIFNYKKGNPTSPEFRGGKNSVRVKSFDYVKDLKKCSREELLEIKANPDKYTKSYVKGKNLAAIHNHPSHGARAFGDADLKLAMQRDWEDYCIAVSEKETWIFEAKDKYSPSDIVLFTDDVQKLYRKANKEAIKELEDVVMDPKQKSKDLKELVNKKYGDSLLDYINNHELNIKVKRVVH